MIRQQQAGCARGLRGKAKPSGGELGLDLDRRQRGNQRAALQALFERPGGAKRVAGLDNEKKCGIEPGSDKARPVSVSPFARGVLGKAPQHEIPVRRSLGRCRGNRRKGKTKCRRGVAIGLRPDLVQPAALQLFERHLKQREGAGGTGRGRGRARCGGDGQRHGNLLERADLRA